MNLYFRMLCTLLGLWARRIPRPRISETSILRFRVWFLDIDFNIHMNNGRYLTLMDFGRMHLCFGAGLVGVMIRKGWFPTLGGAQIQFRRELRLFKPFELRTRLVHWDEKWIYFEQEFWSEGKLAAVAIAKALLRSRQGNVPTRELFAAMGETFVERPDAPELVQGMWTRRP